MIRNCKPEDHQKITSILPEWWDGRKLSLPRLFFDHFQDTSFIIEREGKIIGFLVGFFSQTRKNEAYIHFVGIHPEFRKRGLGQELYEHFYRTVKKNGVDTVTSITSIVNKKSIAYHTRIGFGIVPGDKEIDGISIHRNHGGEGIDRVLFKKHI